MSAKQYKKKLHAVHYLRFPKDAVQRSIWASFCGREDINFENERICSCHFKEEDFENDLQFKMGFRKQERFVLKLGAVPTILELTNIPRVQEELDKVLPVTPTYTECQCNKDIKLLREEIKNLREENLNLKVKIESLEQDKSILEKAFGQLFTKGQIQKLKTGEKRKVWNEEDITRSITIYSTSPKAYKLLWKKSFPLPSVRTLQRWAQKLDIKTGILEPVLQVLSASNYLESNLEKLCVLSFDEMKLKKRYNYDKPNDATLAPVSYVQVAMLRGLTAKWKQPIFYNFDCQITKEILSEIFKSVQYCGFQIVAVVSDLAGGNRKLFTELQVDFNKPWFLHEEKRIFVFADVPNLIKLLRNHFIDNGFIINGKAVTKEIIFKLLGLNVSDLSITHKVSLGSLNVVGAERQKVKLAAKLFSHTIAQSITRAASIGFLEGYNWHECHELFKLTNDWFDVMNVRVPRADSRSRCHAYGLALDTQNDIVNKMTQMMLGMRVIGKNSLLPFQRGIIQSNNALKMLHEDLKQQHNIQYILTYRLNQDVLENFFGIIRSKGGLHDHPDQQAFRYRLRSYILGHNEGLISNGGSIEVDDTPDLEGSDILSGYFLKALSLCIIHIFD